MVGSEAVLGCAALKRKGQAKGNTKVVVEAVHSLMVFSLLYFSVCPSHKVSHYFTDL